MPQSEFSETKSNKSHILVIPYPAPGHLLPLMELTYQLALHDLAITIVITPKNLPILQPLLSLHPSIQTLVLPFPAHPAVPAGVENMQELPISFLPNILSALSQLYDPVLQWLQSHPSPPTAIISDLFLGTWTYPLALRLGIRRLGFAPVHAHTLYGWWSSVEKKYHELKKMEDYVLESHAANMASWGVILNTFSDLEGELLSLLKKKILGHDRVWAVGPLLSFPLKTDPNISTNKVMAWLDTCKVDNSVVYVGFGSQITLNGAQMEALANALYKSGVQFIWAVKEPMEGAQKKESDNSVVPTWFEDRTAGKGLVLRGWVPQAAILGHGAVGTYLTHCGWNSMLEGLLSGVLMLAWPMQADHYENAELMVDELSAAVRVCEGLDIVPDPTKLAKVLAESVGQTQVQRARALELGNIGLRSIKPGGSSHIELEALVKDLSLEMKLELE